MSWITQINFDSWKEKKSSTYGVSKEQVLKHISSPKNFPSRQVWFSKIVARNCCCDGRGYRLVGITKKRTLGTLAAILSRALESDFLTWFKGAESNKMGSQAKLWGFHHVIAHFTQCTQQNDLQKENLVINSYPNSRALNPKEQVSKWSPFHTWRTTTLKHFAILLFGICTMARQCCTSCRFRCMWFSARLRSRLIFEHVWNSEATVCDAFYRTGSHDH